jgi:glutamate-1-semialdehyde 2,1-aminomutase
LPAAAFGGRADVMDCLAPLGPVYQAGTLSGNPLAMAAGLKALELLDAPGFYEELDRKTRLLTDHVQGFLQDEGMNACIQRQGSMFTLFFGSKGVVNAAQAQSLDKELFKRFYRELVEKGIYIAPLQQEALFVSSAHSDDHLIQTRDCMIEFLSSVCYANS